MDEKISSTLQSFAKLHINQKAAPLFDTPYEQQLEIKRKETEKVVDVVSELIRNSPYITSSDFMFPPLSVIPSPIINGYRNKMEYTFENDTNRVPSLGLVKTKYGNRPVIASSEVDDCPHINQTSKEIRRCVEEVFRELYSQIPSFNFWKLLTVLTFQSGENLVSLQVNSSFVEPLLFDSVIKAFSDKLLAATAAKGIEIHSLSCISTKHTKPHDTDPTILLHGKPYVTENLLGKKFIVSPRSFFQANTPAFELLLKEVGKFLQGLPKKPILLDLCCGTGAIGIALSDYVKSVKGIEIIGDAVIAARKNAELNGIKNVEFIEGQLENTIYEVLNTLPKNEEVVAVVDPPRAGVHRKVLEIIKKSSIKHLVFLSCDPAGFRANIPVLCTPESTYDNAFKPVKLFSVDLFPHATNWENVIVMQRK